jgi:hypothetical protein
MGANGVRRRVKGPFAPERIDPKNPVFDLTCKAGYYTLPPDDQRVSVPKGTFGDPGR